MTDLNQLPSNLPTPTDDGATSHLQGLTLPAISLNATSGILIDLSQRKGLIVIYFYPKTGRPNVPLPVDWDIIPGARGCTPQACAFRDHMEEMKILKAEVFGVSSQSTLHQSEAKKRLHLPFELLSDESLKFKDALRLPTFLSDQEQLYRRVTLIVGSGTIVKVFYPVFPPDKNAEEVIAWIRKNKK